MRLLVVGAGGHAKVVIDAAEEAGFEIAGVVGTAADAADVLGHLVSRSRDGIEADAFIVAIGDNRTRARYFEEYRSAGLAPAVVVHPSAILGKDVETGGGTFLAPGVIVNTGTRIGHNVILNTGCSVDHDCRIGDHAHVGPRAALCGAVELGEGVLLGVGASAVPKAAIGEWAVVGAGAAVVGDLPADAVCTGVPARPVRETEG